MASSSCDKSSRQWLTFGLTLSIAVISATSAVIHAYILNKRERDLQSKLRKLEASLKTSIKHRAAERQGRIRAQQALMKALIGPKHDASDLTSYPMKPIAMIKSCFSTRNGTPRQPLVVPLARACLMFNTSRAPPASLEGLEGYSHCWILYVFHLNTDLEKLWKHESNSKFKAKVRVPRLKGGKMGVFATRSPHRPCPIGLTVAKVESVEGEIVYLSGVDLVDGTPVLDVKPYLPYCDSIEGAKMPAWVTDDNNFSIISVSFSEKFASTLSACWETAGGKSLYTSPEEFQDLIKQVLSWDIRSVSQRNNPHNSQLVASNADESDDPLNSHVNDDEEGSDHESEEVSLLSNDVVIYHLILEGLNVAYRIDSDRNVVVEHVSIPINNFWMQY